MIVATSRTWHRSCLPYRWLTALSRQTCDFSCSTAAYKAVLPDAPARTRFAPSPTGYLHLGSLRTALFNYLLAKKTSGCFLLRLEDTDQKRTIPGAETRLYEDLRWANLQWDEGPEVGGPHGPYRQSERTAIYREHAVRLLETPHAYRCFCSAERLQELAKRRKELGLPTDYDRQCAGISDEESNERAARGESHVIRLRAPESYPLFHDLIYGRVGKSQQGFNAGVTHKHGEIAYEDPILLKSDGLPTYHFANVVDDHHMKITHVVRGTEWISSTPKHLALYNAFGWQPPQFAHVGLLVDDQGQKLSKRDMSTDLSHMRDRGILRDALINFTALLGWSHDRGNDVMLLDELIESFQMRFTKGNATVSLTKLDYLQRAHMERLVLEAREETQPSDLDLVRIVDTVVSARAELMCSVDPSDILELPAVTPQQLAWQLLQHDTRNFKTAEQFVKRNRYFFLRTPFEQTYNSLNSTRKATPTEDPALSQTLQLKPLREEFELRLRKAVQPRKKRTTGGVPPPELSGAQLERLHMCLNLFHKSLQKFVEQSGVDASSVSTAWTVEELSGLLLRVCEEVYQSLEQIKVATPVSPSPSTAISTSPSATDSAKNIHREFCILLRGGLLWFEEGPGVAATMHVLGPTLTLSRLTQLKSLMELYIGTMERG